MTIVQKTKNQRAQKTLSQILSNVKQNLRQSKQKKSNTPFRRVKAEEIQLDQRVADNSFLAKGGAEGSYGHKAHMDLIVTRGKAFTKEKNKKKRGSYRGGIIDMASHSIKFD
ncbi:SRP40, C-terminal domain-containing protein [Melampsora americana]|nr:SRP40, C-terminal domain-containing protein [Melampsora americana]